MKTNTKKNLYKISANQIHQYINIKMQHEWHSLLLVFAPFSLIIKAVVKCMFCCCSVTQFCRTHWDLMDQPAMLLCPWRFSRQETLEWVAVSFSRGSSRIRDWTQVPCAGGGFFTTEPPGKPAQCMFGGPQTRRFSISSTSKCAHFLGWVSRTMCLGPRTVK